MVEACLATKHLAIRSEAGAYRLWHYDHGAPTSLSFRGRFACVLLLYRTDSGHNLPSRDFNGEVRPGDNLYTNSVVPLIETRGNSAGISSGHGTTCGSTLVSTRSFSPTSP
jgi:hypothetical protein